MREQQKLVKIDFEARATTNHLSLTHSLEHYLRWHKEKSQFRRRRLWKKKKQKKKITSFTNDRGSSGRTHSGQRFRLFFRILKHTLFHSLSLSLSLSFFISLSVFLSLSLSLFSLSKATKKTIGKRTPEIPSLTGQGEFQFIGGGGFPLFPQRTEESELYRECGCMVVGISCA